MTLHTLAQTRSTAPGACFTSSDTFADSGDNTQLQQHLAHCAAACSKLHRLRTAAEAVDAFLAPRFVSTVVVLAITVAAVSWLSA